MPKIPDIKPEPRVQRNPRKEVDGRSKLHFVIRQWEGELYVDVWILQKEGPASSSLLHGRVRPETADRLATEMGLPVIREERSLQMDHRNDVPKIS